MTTLKAIPPFIVLVKDIANTFPRNRLSLAHAAMAGVRPNRRPRASLGLLPHALRCSRFPASPCSTVESANVRYSFAPEGTTSLVTSPLHKPLCRQPCVLVYPTSQALLGHIHNHILNEWTHFITISVYTPTLLSTTWHTAIPCTLVRLRSI